jgi:hypothetical protein
MPVDKLPGIQTENQNSAIAPTTKSTSASCFDPLVA